MRGRRIDYFTSNFYDYAKLGYFLRFLHSIARAQRCDLARILTASTPEEQETIYQEDIAPALGSLDRARQPSSCR